jgi:hypothetical protein
MPPEIQTEQKAPVDDPVKQAEITTSPPSPKIDLVGDCELMLRFALEENKELDDELLSWIAALDRLLAMNGEPTISGVPPSLNTLAGADPSQVLKDETLSTGQSSDATLMLLKVHCRLSTLIAPASVLSLRTTETQRRGMARYLDMPFVVKGAIVIAFVFMLGFILTLPKAKLAGSAEGQGQSAAGVSNLLNKAEGTNR